MVFNPVAADAKPVFRETAGRWLIALKALKGCIRKTIHFVRSHATGGLFRENAHV